MTAQIRSGPSSLEPTGGTSGDECSLPRCYLGFLCPPFTGLLGAPAGVISI